MRHIWSLLAGIVIAPLAWITIAFGQAVMFEAAQVGSARTLSYGLLFLLGVGLPLGLIGSLRVSPFGPLLVASAYLGATAYLMLAPVAAAKLLPSAWVVLDTVVVPSSPVSSGMLALIGMMLLVAALSPQRWRRWPQRDTANEPSWPEMIAPRPGDRADNGLPAQDSFDGFRPARTPEATTFVDTPSWSAPAKV